MMVDQQLKSVVINYPAGSLYSLIADDKYRATTLSREKWKKLIGNRAFLQPNCNKEGFNVLSRNSQYSKARIGIVANNQNSCVTCNSRIGFGIGGYHDDSSTCGQQKIKAMGYILVQ